MSSQNPHDPRQATPGDDFRRDAELQADPEMQEGPAGAGRIAIYAVAIVVLLGAVFFGLNSSPTTTATAPSATTTADNTPGSNVNRQPGMTTGAAPSTSSAMPAQPIQPPQSNPTGTQVDRNKGPATK